MQPASLYAAQASAPFALRLPSWQPTGYRLQGARLILPPQMPHAPPQKRPQQIQVVIYFARPNGRAIMVTETAMHVSFDAPVTAVAIRPNLVVQRSDARTRIKGLEAYIWRERGVSITLIGFTGHGVTRRDLRRMIASFD